MTKTAVLISRRGRDVPASPIRRLVPYADTAKREGHSIYHLNIGQPDIPTPTEMMAAYHNYRDAVLAYGPSNGLPVFREAIVEYWDKWRVKLSPDEIIATTGGSEAILFALCAVCDPGDQVLVPEPFYTNYLGFAAQAAVEIVPVPASVEDGFRLPSKQAFEGLINDRTRAILFSNPGNPTGVVYSKAEVHTLGELAAENNLFLLADEVYREFVYDDLDYTSVFHMANLDDRLIVLDSVSKRFSACGARVGYLATRNRDVLQASLRFGQARLCPPTVDQIAAAAAYSAPDSYLNGVISEYQGRRDILYKSLQSIPGVTAFKPAGAFYTVAKLPVEDAERFAIWLLTDFHPGGQTVMVAPAEGFYATEGSGRDEVRIAYVLSGDDLERAMNILADGLAAFPG